MVFGLGKDKPRITVATDRAVYQSGDEVQVWVEVPESLGDVTRADIELGYDYEVASTASVPVGDTIGTVRTSHDYTVVVERRSLADTTGSPQFPGRRSIVLQLPVHCPPTVPFNTLNWWVRMVVEPVQTKPLKARAKMKVLSSREANLSHALAPGYCTPGCDLDLKVDDRSIHVGDAVTGLLTVCPLLESVEAHQVTVGVAPYTMRPEAVQQEQNVGIPSRIGKVKVKVAGRMTIDAGRYCEFPFKLPLPRRAQEHPSLETEHLQVVWVLEGRVARTWHHDYLVRVPLNVYTGGQQRSANEVLRSTPP